MSTLIIVFLHRLKRFNRGSAPEMLQSVLAPLSDRSLARLLGSRLPSSQGPASQKVGHLVTFQSSSDGGTHSLHIILLLLFPPLAPSSAAPPRISSSSSSPCPLYCSSPLFQRPEALMVLRPEVDHFNSASQIFFKKTRDPETSEPVTAA